jgi:hypothetical protein
MPLCRAEKSEIGFVFELRHDELGHEPRQGLVALGQVVLVDSRLGGKFGEPSVATVVFQERPQRDHRQRPGVGGEPGGHQPGDVALDQRPSDDRGVGGVRHRRGQERREP